MSLSILALSHEVHLSYVPAHAGIIGNERADAAAKLGSLNGIQVLLNSNPSHLNDTTTKKIITGCNAWTLSSKTQNINSKSFEKLVFKSKSDIRIVAGMVTNHTLLRDRIHRYFNVGKGSSRCRKCQRQDETLFHLLTECSNAGIVQARKNIFEKTIVEMNQIDLNDWRKLLQFAKSTFISDTFQPWDDDTEQEGDV